MSKTNAPEPLYRLLHADEWRAAVADGVYAGNDMDRADGFIHLSLRRQVALTAERFFAGAGDLMVVTVDPCRLDGEVRLEEADGDRFPHLYGTIPLEAVLEAAHVPLDRNGDFRFPERLLGG